MGNSSGAVKRGGCSAKAPQPADGRGGGAPPRTVQRRGCATDIKGHSPCPMTRKSRSQARLLKMGQLACSSRRRRPAAAIAPAATPCRRHSRRRSRRSRLRRRHSRRRDGGTLHPYQNGLILFTTHPLLLLQIFSARLDSRIEDSYALKFSKCKDQGQHITDVPDVCRSIVPLQG